MCKTGCSECRYYRYWPATYYEPSDAECKNCENITEDEFDRFFCDGEKWECAECGCSGFERAPLEDY